MKYEKGKHKKKKINIRRKGGKESDEIGPKWTGKEG